MKRFFGFLALLCLFLTAAAQEDINARGVQIGQQVPDVLVTGASGLTIKGKPRGSFRFSELRGKLVILDFWATWCAPCRAMVPVLDSLKRVFGDKLVILPVAYEREEIIAPALAYLQQVKPFDLPVVTGDKILNSLFPHHNLPHFVWIDTSGIVRAITEEKEVTAPHIRALLSKADITLALKKDYVAPYDPSLPFLLNKNGGDGSAVAYHSVLTRYMPGLGGGTRISKFDPVKGQLFTARNLSYPFLCQMAYSENGRSIPANCIRVLSRDSALLRTQKAGQDYLDWLSSGSGWCYELLVPPALATRALPIMQEDLARVFPQYVAAMESVRTRCLVLTHTGEPKLHSAGGDRVVNITPFKAIIRNAPLRQLLLRLQMQYLQNSTLPVVDGTGFTGPVDLDLEGKLYEVASLNKALAPYHLAFTEKEALVEQLIIRDAPAPLSATP